MQGTFIIHALVMGGFVGPFCYFSVPRSFAPSVTVTPQLPKKLSARRLKQDLAPFIFNVY
jgi:hypothetical protein